VLDLKVIATDPVGVSVSSAFKLTVVNVNDPPIGPVTVTGIPTQGQILTASNNLTDADGLDTATIRYQWLADGSNINGATNSSLTLTQAQVGKAISVKASYTDMFGTAESKTSAATALVTNVNDAPTLDHAMANQNAQQGVAFTFTVPLNTFADVDSGDTLSYTATLACGSALPSWLQFNANTRTFSGTPANGDKGNLELKVIARDSHGASVSGAFKLAVLATAPSNVWTNLLPSGRARAMTTGADGSIFMAGSTSIGLNGETSIGTNGSSDAFVTKYDTNGIVQWTKLLGTSNEDVAYALTTGTDGYIYVAGNAGGDVNRNGGGGSMGGQPLIGGKDGFISKFDPQTGAKQWTHLIGTSGSDYALGLTTGLDGAIFVSGYTPGLPFEQGLDGNHDSFLTKFQPDGTQQWTRLLGTPGDGGTGNYIGNQGITTGADGSIYVGGFTYGPLVDKTSDQNIPSNWHYNGVVTKYDTDGTLQWARLIGTNGDNSIKAICTGADGSIYVGGDTNESLDGKTNHGSYDAFITKFKPDGTKQWTTELGGVNDEAIIAMKSAPDGSIYVSGTTGIETSLSNPPRDIVLAKVHADGTVGWTQTIGTSGDDRAAGMTISDDGSALYLGGYTTGALNGETIVAPTAGGRQPFIAKYSIDYTV
jgi:hypothetical protein